MLPEDSGRELLFTAAEHSLLDSVELSLLGSVNSFKHFIIITILHIFN